MAVIHHPLMMSSGVPCGTTPIRTLFCTLAYVIGMPMVGVPTMYVIRMWYSDHYSDWYIIGMLYGGRTSCSYGLSRCTSQSCFQLGQSHLVFTHTYRMPPLDYEELGPYDEGPSPTSHGTLPDYLHVLPEVPDCSLLTLVASLDKWDHSIPSPSCSLDTFLSLVFDKEPTTPSPTCSPDVFWVLFPIQVVLQIFWLFHRTILTCYWRILTGFLLFNGETRAGCQKRVWGLK